MLAAGLIPFLSASNSKGKAIFESFCFNPFSVRSFIRFMWEALRVSDGVLDVVGFVADLRLRTRF